MQRNLYLCIRPSHTRRELIRGSLIPSDLFRLTDSPVAFGDGLAAVTRRREPGVTHVGLGGPGGGPGDPLGGFNALRALATAQSVER